jgi:hypothetical protein
VAWMDLDIVVESEEPWASFDYSVLMLWPSGVVGLDRPPPGMPSGGFLGGEGIRLEGLTERAPEPLSPEAGEGICPFVSRPMRDFVEGVGDSAVPIGQHQRVPEPWALGSSLALGSDWRWG